MSPPKPGSMNDMDLYEFFGHIEPLTSKVLARAGRVVRRAAGDHPVAELLRHPRHPTGDTMSFRDLELTIGCEKCGAVIGQMCRTSTNLRSSLVHSARAEPIYAAWRQGFWDGQADIICALDDGDDRYIEARRQERAS